MTEGQIFCPLKTCWCGFCKLGWNFCYVPEPIRQHLMFTSRGEIFLQYELCRGNDLESHQEIDTSDRSLERRVFCLDFLRSS